MTRTKLAVLLIGSAVAIGTLLLIVWQDSPREPDSISRPASPLQPGGSRYEDPSTAPQPSQQALAIPDASGATADDNVPSILVEIDATTKARLKPWFEEYRAQIKGSEPVTEYDFFRFDAVVIQNIQSGAVKEIRFALNDQHSYKVAFDYSSDYDTGQIIVGHLPNYPQRSSASIYVLTDGTVTKGSVQAVGSAMLIILPVPDSPYHVIFSQTGTVPVD